MSKILAFVAAGIIVGAGAFSFIVPRAMADSSTSTNSGYQQMQQFMDSPQGQEMYQQCNNYMQQWNGGQPGN